MIKYLFLLFLAFSQRTVAVQDENRQRNLRKRQSYSSPSIAAIAAETDKFSTLVSVLEKTGLDTALDCSGWSRWRCKEYTVFAPEDDAFDALAEADPALFDALTGEDQYEEHLRQLLLYHVVKGSVKSDDIQDGPVLSVQGEELELRTENGITVNEANVADPFDVEAKNGVIHTVDSVLLPSFITDDIPTVATKAPEFNKLVQALKDAGLVDALRGGPFTVFAPTDEAFANADLEGLDVAEVLKYHVVQGIALKSDIVDGPLPTLAGRDVQVDVERNWRSCAINLNGDTTVIDADVLARNGIIHVIDKVLLPPSVDTRGTTDASTILDIAADGDDFSTLAEAVGKFNDLVTALGSEDEGPFTVFAPTDQAFQELGIDLATLSNDELKNILEYHVVLGEFFSQSLPDSTLVDSLNGKGIAIDARHGVVLNGNTHVTAPDIAASNGVIHVIDKVLIPPENLVEVLVADGRFEALVAAVTEAGLAQTLAGEDNDFTIFAPTDDAFAQIPEEELNALFADTAALTNLLLYHVADGFLPFQALQRTVPTKAGDETISLRAYWWWSLAKGWFLRIFVNGNQARVVDADILASNGAIHAIDGVLSP